MADRAYPLPAIMMALAVLLPVLAGPAAAQQGFADLGRSTNGYAAVPTAPDLRFPRDHGAHPDFRIEWWYLTANLKQADGTPLGLQWTLFRQAVRPPDDERDTPQTPWAGDQVWMAHSAVTTPESHHFAEKLARGGVGHAGVRLDPFTARLDDWALSATGPVGERLSPLRLQAGGDDFSYDVQLAATGPLVRHGKGGVSRKSDRGHVSIYLSQPFYRVTGSVTVAGRERQVTGRAWLDREWSSQPLSPDQTGWDWFSLHLENEARLMLFRLRSKTDAPFLAGSWISPSGAVRDLTGETLHMTPLATEALAAADVPVRWRLRLPDRGVDVTVTALNPAAWNAGRVAYWEGPVTVTGSHDGTGYLEMTGYDQPR